MVIGITGKSGSGKSFLSEKIKEKLEKLNKFCQTQMEIEIDEIIASSNQTVILDYALLPWMKQFKKCDIKMLVSASFEDRFKRVQERENVTKEYFENRDKKIAGYNEFKFDLEVDNSKPLNINDILDFIKSKQEHNND